MRDSCRRPTSTQIAPHRRHSTPHGHISVIAAPPRSPAGAGRTAPPPAPSGSTRGTSSTPQRRREAPLSTSSTAGISRTDTRTGSPCPGGSRGTPAPLPWASPSGDTRPSRLPPAPARRTTCARLARMPRTSQWPPGSCSWCLRPHRPAPQPRRRPPRSPAPLRQGQAPPAQAVPIRIAHRRPPLPTAHAGRAGTPALRRRGHGPWQHRGAPPVVPGLARPTP